MGLNKFRDKVGIQLYSLRNEIEENIDNALYFVKDQGIKNIELAGFGNLSPKEYNEKLLLYGLNATCMGADFETYKENIELIIDQALIFDLKYVMCPSIPYANEKISLIEMQQAVNVFNIAGKKLKEKGIQFCYHNHGFEFVPYKNETLFDYLFKNTDAENVKFELDIFWAQHCGQNPVELLKKYGQRIELMHIKDMDKKVIGNFTGQENIESDVAWGTGQIDVKSCCLLGAKLGVKHFYLEDESSKVIEQIPISLKFAESF
jgi:sugar phosphate isomerase/epimerase